MTRSRRVCGGLQVLLAPDQRIRQTDAIGVRKLDALSDGRPHSNPTRERGDRLSVRNVPASDHRHGREFSLSLIRAGFGKKVGLVTRPRYTTYRQQESQHRGPDS